MAVVIRELLLPATDAGVLAQLIVVVVAWFAGLWIVRKRPDIRLFVLGLGLVTLAAIGVRTLH